MLGFNQRGFYPVLGFQDRSLRARPTLQKNFGQVYGVEFSYLQGSGMMEPPLGIEPSRLLNKQDNPHPFGPKILVSPAGIQPAA